MTDVFKRISAHAFASDLGLDELRHALTTAGPWSWIERDSGIFGDYISALAKDDYAVLKVFATEPGGYQIDIRFETSGDDPEREWRELEDDVLHRLLPAVRARYLGPTDTMV